MVHSRILFRTIGTLLIVEVIMLLLCCGMAFYYGEDDRLAFAVSAVVVLAACLCLRALGSKAGGNLNRREAFFVVGTTWLIYSLFGMLPLMLSGYYTSPAAAFFEAMSGFTTTGTTILPSVEVLPHGILFWRSLSQFVGGLGIIFFTLIILPAAGEGNVRLFSAEMSGVAHERLHPRIRTTVVWIFLIYVFLTAACTGALCLCGVDWFDSLNHAMATTATGGFSTHDSGISFFRSPAVEYVIIAFMFIAATSFYVMLLTLQRRSLRFVRQNDELRLFTLLIVVTTIVAAVYLFVVSGNAEYSIRTALFNVVALQSSTGFLTENVLLWWQPLAFFLILTPLIGGCAGSTAGGFKCIRVLTLMRTARQQFKLYLHPKLVLPIRVNGHFISDDMSRNILSLLFWYFVIFVAGALLLALLGVNFIEAMHLALCCLSNIGITGDMSHMLVSEAGYASVADILQNPLISTICALLMLVGRLEIFPLLLPLTAGFWKDN